MSRGLDSDLYYYSFHFRQALQVYKGDPGPVILEIINTIEGGPQVDVSVVHSMYDHFAKSAPTILDNSLSADLYLNILYMPSTFPRSEKSRWSQESTSNSRYSPDFYDGPQSKLDNAQYNECVPYLQEGDDFVNRNGIISLHCQSCKPCSICMFPLTMDGSMKLFG